MCIEICSSAGFTMSLTTQTQIPGNMLVQERVCVNCWFSCSLSQLYAGQTRYHVVL